MPDQSNSWAQLDCPKGQPSNNMKIISVLGLACQFRELIYLLCLFDHLPPPQEFDSLTEFDNFFKSFFYAPGFWPNWTVKSSVNVCVLLLARSGQWYLFLCHTHIRQSLDQER